MLQLLHAFATRRGPDSADNKDKAVPYLPGGVREVPSFMGVPQASARGTAVERSCCKQLLQRNLSNPPEQERLKDGSVAEFKGWTGIL